MKKINFSTEQISNEKRLLQKKIFYMLLIVDPETADQYPNTDVNKAFDDLFADIDGINELLGYPVQIVNVAKKLAKAHNEYQSPDFKYKKYRKLVLDAGSEVEKIEV